MRFVKYHGLGNDFLVRVPSGPPGLDDGPPWRPDEVIRLCRRGHGVGADGVVALRPAEDAHLAMDLVNADGSRPEMCGNGLRCVVKHAVDRLGLTDNPLTVATGAGVLPCTWTRGPDGQVSEVSVGMGAVSVEPATAPSPDGETLRGWRVLTGNPHFVRFESICRADAASVGPWLERHEAFPGGTNVEWATPSDPGSGADLDVLVWERGCGFTEACGTGATAVAVAACHQGLRPLGEPTRIRLPGGVLTITPSADGETATMRGPATRVYEGETG